MSNKYFFLELEVEDIMKMIALLAKLLHQCHTPVLENVTLWQLGHDDGIKLEFCDEFN